MKHSIAVGVLGALAVTPVIYAQSQAPASSFIAVSPNVNVLRGIDSLQGDKLLQRQNEPVAAVSTRNPGHIMVAANDYRAVEKGNDPGLGDALTRLARQLTWATEKVVARVLGRLGFEDGDEELEKAEAGTEAWIGLYFSNDGGKSYSSHFMPGSPDDLVPISKSSPIFGRHAASDPVLASAPAGRFYLGAMAFDRDPVTKEISFSQIVVSRFTDRNNSESGQNFHYDGMTLVDNGTVPARKFLDKPAIAADIHRSSGDPAACGPVYIAFTVFDQQEKDEMERSKILLATSNDCGISFAPPNKISHRSKLNQGVALAIRPSDGALFAVYRSFSEKKMFLVSSTDGGHSFTAAQAISGTTPIRAFDQPTLAKDDNYSFRTNAFPTIAIDGRDNIFVAWQERLVDNGNPRIVITSSADGRVWTARRPAESVRCEAAAAAMSCSDKLIGPQVMPSLSFSRGRLMLLFYEARPGLDNVKWVASQQASFITGIDAELTVRAAQLDSSGRGSSALVTHYDTDKNGSVVPLIATGKDGRQYRGINRPNLPMYAAGTSPFMGDYISLTPTMPFIPAGASEPAAAASSSGNGKDNGKTKKTVATPYWRWATEPTDAPTPAFVAVWGDNRDVVFPKSPLTGDAAIDGPWPQYSLGDGPCINPGSRNANVYAATMSTRLVAGTPTTFKPLDIQRAFVLFVQNQTADRKFYRLTILDSPPAVNASFVQVGTDQNVLDVEVFPLSTATQNVFATAQSMTSSQAFAVTVAEVTAQGGTIVPGGDTATVLFNSDRSNPQLAVTDLTSERHSPRIFNPDSPSKTTPRITNPQVSNPQVSNPQVSNPQVSNPQVSNPQVSNLQLTNSPLADPATPVYSNVTNYTWQVANVGDTTSAFAPIFNIANEAVRRNNSFTLYIYKTYRTPTFVMTSNGCRVVEAPHDEIISVVDNPQVSNPQVSNPQVSNPQVSNPQVSNPQVSNSTFFVAPTDASAAGVGTTAARRIGALTLAAFQSPAPTTDDITTLAAAEAPTYITLSIRSGDPDAVEDPPPAEDGHSPRAVHPPLSEDDFSTGGSAVAVTATSNDVIRGVIQAVPEAATTGSDLIISTPPTISVSPNADVPAGTVVTFSSFTIQNIGQQATRGAFKFGFYLSTSSQIDPRFATLLGSSVFTPSIDSGATAVLSGGSFTIPADTLPSDYFIGVRINSGDPSATPPDPKLFEPEFNDSFTIAIRVVPGANLAIVQGSLAPSTLFAGQTTTAILTVANVGTAPAAPSSTAFFRSADAVLSGNDTLLGTVQTPALAPGSSAIVQVPLVIPANTAVGPHSVIASADATSAVPESSEFDNAFALSLRVVNTPSTLTFQQQPSAVIAGHAIAPPAQVSVTTQGTAVAGALVQMTLVPVSGTATVAGTTAAVSDAAGIATFANLIVSEAGTYRLSASAPTLGSTPAVLSGQFTVTANHAPTADPDAYATAQAMALTVAAPGVLANDRDADGDPLTAVLVTAPANGQFTLNADGSFSYMPSPPFFGSDSFVYAARDGIMQSASATVTITVSAANRAPTARDDTATTTAGVAVAIDVLLNDTDEDGDALLITEIGMPAHGTALLTPPGIITYTPAAGFSGSDSFTSTVTDGRGGSSTARVNVTVDANLDVVSTTLREGVVFEGQPPIPIIGGHGSRSVTLLSGSLPPGLTLTATGGFAGAPTTHGSFEFTVSIADCTPSTTCAAGTVQQTVTRTLSLRVSAMEQQSFGTGGATSFDFGGSTGRRVAQVFTVGANGLLTAIRLNQLLCPAGATIRVGIERVTNGAPDGTEIAFGTGPGTFDPVRLDTPLAVAIDQQFAFVVSTPTICQMRNLATFDSYNGGDAFILGPTPQRLKDVEGFYDFPFRTFIQPSTTVAYLNRGRFGGSTATLLSDGKVLIAGSDNSAELYDPATNTSALTGNMTVQRFNHTATLLNDGTVLVVGGRDSAGNHLASAEIYDPVTGQFTGLTASLATGRQLHTATRLADGRVLIAGGLVQTGPVSTGVRNAEIFDPASKTFSPAGDLVAARWQHTATILSSGKLLLAGGFTTTFGPPPRSAELYDQATGTFAATTGNMVRFRGLHTATLLLDGRVLIAGGAAGDIQSAAEIYDPTTDTFSETGSMAEPRFVHTATPLADGSVLVAGGFDEVGVASYVLPLATMERFVPGTGTFISAGSMEARRQGHTATRLQSGKVLLAGGGSQSWMTGDSAELFDAASAPALTTTSIPDGEVGVPYAPVFLSATAGAGPPYHIDIVSGAPPNGIVYDSGSFTLAGTPTTAGNFTFGVRVTDAAAQMNVQSLTIRVSPLGLTSPYRLVDAALNQPYSVQLTATAAATWALAPASSALPPGLTLNSAGVISGTPTSLGFYSFAAIATDVPGRTVLKVLSIFVNNPFVITTATLNDGVLFEFYGGCLQASAGNGQRTWAVTAGSLPPGLTLQTNGCFAGQVGAFGIFSFTAQVTDESAPPQIDFRPLTINVSVAVDQSTAWDATLPPVSFGGSVKIGQSVIAGVAGELKFVRIPTLACPAGTTVNVEVQGLGPGGIPDGNTIAFGNFITPEIGNFFALKIALSPTPFMPADARFALVFTADRTCNTSPMAFDGYPGDGFVFSNSWHRLSDVNGRSDISFQTLVQPADGLLLMKQFRGDQQAIALPDSRVLLTATGSTLAEIYDPVSGTFSMTGPMNVPRLNASAALLDDGTVLITGGYNFLPPAFEVIYFDSAEIFHPDTGTFELLGGRMTSPRTQHSATKLRDGRVLVAGGYVEDASGFHTLQTAELYDPSARTFTSISANLSSGRVDHTSTLLDDGRVLLAGGWFWWSAEIFDPITSTFSQTARMLVARQRHTATLLNDGRVLLAGGYDGSNGVVSNDGELFDPAGNGGAGTFTFAGTMSSRRVNHAAVLLADGSVLVTGGVTDNSCCAPDAPVASMDRFVPDSGFTGAGTMLAARYFHTATRLANGKVLLAGTYGWSSVAGRSAEFYDSAAAISLANATPPDGHNGSPYAGFQLTPQGGTGPYTIAFTGGTLPSGLVFEAATRTVSGTPTVSGSFYSTFTITDSAGHTRSQTLTFRIDPLDITSTTLPPAFENVPYNALLTATGVAPVTWMLLSGSLPPGLTLSPDGMISGTPTASCCSYYFTVRATDAIGQTATRQLHIDARARLTITTTALPDAGLFDFYGSCLSWSGGIGAPTWSLAAGSGPLPKGVTLQSYGCFAGTAESVGTFDIVVEATDSTSPPEIATKPLSIAILAHDQEAGGPNTANQISFGASTGRSLAQAVTAGTHGLLTSVNAWNMTCPPGASLSVEIQGVTPTDFRPNGTVLATGTGFWYAPIRVSPQPEFGKDERFAIVFSSTADCTLDSVSPEERYWRGGAFERVGISAWQRRADLADIPFRTLITPQAKLTYLDPPWRAPLTATLLDTGKVLLVGGSDSTVVLYDVAAAAAETTGAMAAPRSDHTATLLNDGTVLVAGGRDNDGRALSTADIYDPSLGTFTPITGTLSNARMQHTATLLADGRVLLAGGFNESGGLASVELYDPATRTFAMVGSMLGSRWIHTATRLNDGRVLFVGGATNGPFPVPNGEVYDPTTNSSTPTSEPITFLRARHTATLLSDGRVLIAGGTRFYPQLEPVAEFYDPATNRLVSGPSMLLPRADFTATRLINPVGAGSDEIAMIGGVQSDEAGTEPISQVEVYAEVLGAFVPAGSLAVDRARHGAVPVGVRRVLVAGGSSSGWLASHTTEMWDERFNIVPLVLPDGHTDIDYSQVLEANGGRTPFTVSVITGGVPPGLTVTPISGFGQYRLQIAGTPTASGSYTFSVKATDVIGSITQSYTIRIDPATIVTTTLANAAVGTAYDQALSATGVGAVTWDVPPGSAPLPSWLTLASAGHLIAANPPSSGFFFFTVRATDSVGQTATLLLGLFVESPLVITTTALGDAVAPWWYGWCFSWEGGNYPAHFAVSDGALPYGLTLQDYGCFTGNALQTGSFQFDVTANDGAQRTTKTFTLRSGTADQAQFSIDQSTPPSAISFGGATVVAQVFTTAMHGSLIDLEIPVSCSDAGLRLEIRGVTAGRPNTTVLGFEDFSAADVAPFQFGPYHRQLRLTAPIFLAKGAQAAAVLESTGSCTIYLGAANQTYQFGDAFVGVAENWTAIESFDPTRPDIPFHAIVDDGGRLLFETNGRSETVGVGLSTGPNAGTVLFASGSGNSSTLFNATDHSINGLPSHQFGFEAPVVDFRRRHTLTTLSDGRVLAIGGWDDQQQSAVSRLEMYDPATNTWTMVSLLNSARFNHTATLIAGDRVLIAGGQTRWGGDALSSTEIFVYDGNGAGHLVGGPPLNDARFEFSAVALPNGQVALIGGVGPFTPGIELYTPDAGVGTFTRDIQLQVPRALHAAILLACPAASPCAYGGKVLILGGWLSTAFGAALQAELYDPLAHTSTTVGSMIDERALFAAVQLNDGRVLAAGGNQHSGVALSSIEIYDPTTEAFHAAGEMTVPRGGIAAAHLSDDSALFVGGFGASAASWGSAELFAPDRLLRLGRLDTAYVNSIPAHGTSPFTFTLKSGALPPGIELDSSTGALSGTPTQTGRFTFVIGIVDSSTFGRESLFDGTIEVDAASASRALNIVEASVAFIDRSTGTLTVQLEDSEAPAPAPAGGFDVLLASSNPACVSVQTIATIPSAQSAVEVTVAPGGTAPLPCTSIVTVSGTQAAGDAVNVTVTPSTAPRPNPTGPGTTMVSFFNPAPVVGGPQRQLGTFASVSYSSPISGQQTPMVTSASTTAVSFFNPAPTAQPTPAVRNSLTMLSYFNPAPVFTAVQRQVATLASISFSNPTSAQQTPTVVSRASTTSVSFFNPAPVSQPTNATMVRSGLTTLSFFNPAPVGQPTVSATMRSSLTTLSFFNPAPVGQPTVSATMRSSLTTLSFFNPAPVGQPSVSAAVRNGLTTLSFFNPAPLPTTQMVRTGAAAAPAVSFANGSSTGSETGTSAPRTGGTLDALRFAAGPTITEISPAVLSRSAPAPIIVITGANLSDVTDVTFSDPTGITIGAFSVSPDGRTLTIPIVLAPATPLATIAVVVTGAMGSSPITDQTVVMIVP